MQFPSLLLRFWDNYNAPTVIGREILYQQKAGVAEKKEGGGREAVSKKTQKTKKKTTSHISPVKFERELRDYSLFINCLTT